MKKIALRLGGTLIFCLFIFANYYAQESTKITLNPDNVSLLLSEVFLNCKDDLPKEIEVYKKMISQIEIITLNPIIDNLDKYALLSSLSLKNKCNLEMIHDGQDLIIESFNPFKYFFNFYSKIDLFYRVDNTNFLIKIKAN